MYQTWSMAMSSYYFSNRSRESGLVPEIDRITKRQAWTTATAIDDDDVLSRMGGRLRPMNRPTERRLL